MSLCKLLIAALSEECEMTEDKAKATAIKIVSWGAKNGHAGIEHYWPVKLRAMTPADRDLAIRKQFNGSNLAEVCQKFDVSHETVYRAVRQ